MESNLTELKRLAEAISGRINSLTRESIHPIEADILRDMLKQMYLLTENIRMMPAAEFVPLADQAQYSSQVSKPLDTPPLPPVADMPPVTPPLADPVIPVVPQVIQPEIKPAEREQFVKPVAPEIKLPVKQEFTAQAEFNRDPGPSPYTHHPGQPADLFASATLADKLKTDTPSLNDTITGKNDLTVADRMKLKPVSDLRTAIGLNDKFQLINELFKGSAEEYNRTLEKLNTCSDSADAYKLLFSLMREFQWDDESPAFLKLQEFVVRRYM